MDVAVGAALAEVLEPIDDVVEATVVAGVHSRVATGVRLASFDAGSLNSPDGDGHEGKVDFLGSRSGDGQGGEGDNGSEELHFW